MRTRLTLPFLAVIVGCAGGTPSELPTADLPPVVLISIDTLRSDRLPAYGYAGVETPAIDALRRKSILFAQAYAHYPMTLPSHVSLLTGILPPGTGVRDNAGYRLGDAPQTLADLLRGAGYATGAAVSSFVLRRETGIARGFDAYDDAVDVAESADLFGPERRGADTLARAREWLAGVAPGRPYLLFFHLYEPHFPYDPPEPFATRWGRTYEGEIAAADAVVGGLVAELERRGDLDRALLVLLSDHGEGLKDHVEATHGALLYREAIQVPLLVKLPGGARAGERVETTVGLVDVLPTVLAAVGLAAPAGIAGRSLLAGEAEGKGGGVYAETMYPRLHFGWSELTSLVDGRFHLIDGPDPELYDLVADPGETRNLRDAERRTFHDLASRLAAYRAPLAAPEAADPETAARLAALGYASGGASVDDATAAARDPKAELRRVEALSAKAQAAYQRGDYEEAALVLRGLTGEGPRMTEAWELLGRALRELGRDEEALAAFERLLELSQGSPHAALQAGRVLAALGRLDAARGLLPLARESEGPWGDELELEIALAARDLEAALGLVREERPAGRGLSRDVVRRTGIALSRGGRFDDALGVLAPLAEEKADPPLLNALAQVHLGAGRVDLARPLLDQALALAPDDSAALENLGLVALQTGKPADAVRRLERSLEVNDRAPNAWNLLGVARHQTGDVAGALAAWKRAVELDGGQLDALYNLAFTAARSDRRDLALPALRRYLETAPPDRFGRELAAARSLLAELRG